MSIKFSDRNVQLIKGKENIAQAVFTVAVIVELIVMMTDHFASWTIPYRGRITHIAFALFCIKILMTKYDYRQAAIFLMFGLLGIISYITCDDEYVIRAVAFIAASVGADIAKNLKIIFAVTLVGTLIIVLLALTGAYGNIVDIRDYGRGMIEARYCLGFNHANNVHDIYWYLLCLYMLIRRDKVKWIDLGVMTVLNAFIYYLTRSRTGVIAAQFIIIGFLLVRYLPWVRDGLMMQIGCILSLIVTVFMTVYGSIYNVYEREFVAKTDKILTGRMEMMTEHANFKDWMMFPPSRSAEYVDNGFSSLIYSYGTVVGAVFIILLLAEMIALIRNRGSINALLLASAVLVLFMESTFVLNISLLCNMLLIILTVCINDHSDASQIVENDENSL